MKRLFSVLLALMMLCSCVLEEIPEKESILEQNPGETCTLPEDITGEQKEPETPEKDKNEMPEISGFYRMFLYPGSGGEYEIDVSKNFPEKFAGALKWKSWVGPAMGTDLTPAQSQMITVLYDKDMNELFVYAAEEVTVIKMSWGENRRNETVLVANKEVAKNLKAFCESQVSFEVTYGNLPKEFAKTYPMPEIEDFDVIFTGGDGGSTVYNEVKMTKEEYEKIHAAMQKEKWEEYDPEKHTVNEDNLGPGSESMFYIGKDETEGKKKGKLYIAPFDEYTKITLRWNYNPQETMQWVAPKEVASDVYKIGEKIAAESKSDGRDPFLNMYDEHELIYGDIPEFNKALFSGELMNFVSNVSGEFNEYDRLSPKESLLWCAIKAHLISVENHEETLYDEDGRIMVSAEKIKTAAKYIFGISDITKCVDFENGYYVLPFGGRIINPKIAEIEENNGYIHCEVEFYDSDDYNFDAEPYARKFYNFRAFSAEDRIWYRPLDAGFVFGSEWYF